MPIVTTDSLNKQKNSINPNEISHFNQLAEKWWDRKGPMSALHDVNDLRVEWIHNHLTHHHSELNPSKTLLDIGCGAGLASEALANLGYNVIGVDAAEKVIQAAQYHLQKTPLLPNGGSLHYQVNSIEKLIEDNQFFPIITALELLEHVNDPTEFITNLAHLLQPKGKLFVSTLNRTLSSFLMAKVMAEYIVRKLPIGTHSWKQFITPGELGTMAHQAGLRVEAIAGITLYPNGWKLSKNLKINYIACLSKS